MNKRNHPDILALQLRAARAYLYDLTEVPQDLKGPPLIQVQDSFTRVVETLSVRNLPGMEADWYPDAVTRRNMRRKASKSK